MATNNIAQTFDGVKQKISTGTSSKPFATDTEFMTGYSRVDSNQKDHRISASLRSVMVKQIMNGQNEEALALLSSVGPIGFVPGIGENSIPLNEFADFYGVSEKYLTDLLSRKGFTLKLCPNDITRKRLYEIIAEKAPLTICCAGEQKRPKDLATYHVNGSHCQIKVSMPRHRMFGLYSPRIVLATALMMVYTDKSDLDGNIKKTLLALKRSPYRFVKRMEDKSVDAANQNRPIEGIPLTANGELLLSPEILSHIIKTAVKEAVSEVVAEMWMPAMSQSTAAPVVEQAPKKSFPAKLEKPAEWDAILSLWRSGSLSVTDAAKMAGMSTSSFRNYANGKKTFS